MPVDKDKMTKLVTEAAIVLLDLDEETDNGWYLTYNDAISQAFTSLQVQARAFGAHLSWSDFDDVEVWAAIQKDRASR